jgi:hypothetical protein
MNPRDLSALFSMMGAKYVPSVVYRIRMLTFSSSNVEDEVPAISGIGLEAEPAEKLSKLQGAKRFIDRRDKDE